MLNCKELVTPGLKKLSEMGLKTTIVCSLPSTGLSCLETMCYNWMRNLVVKYYCSQEFPFESKNNFPLLSLVSGYWYLTLFILFISLVWGIFCWIATMFMLRAIENSLMFSAELQTCFSYALEMSSLFSDCKSVRDRDRDHFPIWV